MTNKQLLQKLATTTMSTETDSAAMQEFLRKAGFPKAVVTSGVVYLEGHGEPADIHTTAKTILSMV